MTEPKAEIADVKAPTPAAWKLLLMLVAMNGLAPVSLYILVPALPILAKTLGSDVSAVQLNVSLFMVGLAISQLVTGSLSDRFGRRPVLLGGFGLAVIATIICMFAETLPQLIAGRFLQALGSATGMVMSRAIIRDLYPRERVGGMISLVGTALFFAASLYDSTAVQAVAESPALLFAVPGVMYLLSAHYGAANKNETTDMT